MQKNRLPRLLLVVSLLIALGAGMFVPRLERVEAKPLAACPGGIITQWTFWDGFADTTLPTTGLGTFTNGAGINPSVAPYTFFAGNPDRAISFTSWNTGTLDETAYIEFQVPTTGATFIQLSFDFYRSGTGPTSLQIRYSPDFNTIPFVDFGSPISVTNATTWLSHTVNFSSITDLDNNPNASFRIYGYGASGGGGTLRFDNVAIAELCPPSIEVMISEVAWAGTRANPGHEWIELYNPGSSAIDLAGWRLVSSDGTPNITLSGTIPAGGYFLLEREEFATNIPSDLLYTGALADAGESLFLYDASDTLVDSANGNGGAWPAGNSTNFASMERIGTLPDGDSSWFTNNGVMQNGLDFNEDPVWGTPKNINSLTPTPTATITPSPTITFTPTATITPTRTITPTASQTRSVIINEIAWTGTAAGLADDEWIELYNPGGTSINITGWRLVASDGFPAITLSGEIPAGGYFLLERTHDDVVSDIDADQIYSGALSNDGEILILYDASNKVIDTANGNGGPWPKGSLTTYGTMERMGISVETDASWNTNNGFKKNGKNANGGDILGTPKESNSPAPTPTSTQTITPTSVGMRSVIINEVAWAGTSSSHPDDEWIELYNPNNFSINITGWRLRSYLDGTPDILLAGTILPGGYFLLERDDDNTVSDIKADQIYTGALNNGGEILILYDGAGRIVDTANGNGGSWPAGSASTYGSMERRTITTDIDSSWHTNTGIKRNGKNASGGDILGTPKSSNSAGPTPTPTRTPTRTVTPLPPSINARLIINEFLVRPGFDWNRDGIVDVYDEFIEIKNLTPINVDLRGWRLDDQVGGSASPFNFPNITLRPGEYIVFFRAETKISLSDGGGTIRLLNPQGRVYDEFTYPFARTVDHSFCRIPDGGLSSRYWFEDCIPTPNLVNTREGTVPSMPGGGYESLVCELPDTIPSDFLTAECRSYGTNIWDPYYWDRYGWLGWRMLQSNTSKWESYFE